MAGAPIGNDNARKGRRYRDAIHRALAKRYGSVEQGFDAIADKLLNAAETNERWAIEEIGNREDGKPAQIVAGDTDLPPVQVEGRIKLVRPE